MLIIIDWWIENSSYIADFATVFGIAFILIAIMQWIQTNKQSATDFEDELSREYRELARKIPPKILLNQKFSDEEYEEAFPYIYQYIDLSNEQIFLRQRGRIRNDTWLFWSEGIKSNLEKAAFSRAWNSIKSGYDGFKELKELEKQEFRKDPYSRWNNLRAWFKKVTRHSLDNS